MVTTDHLTAEARTALRSFTLPELVEDEPEAPAEPAPWDWDEEDAEDDDVADEEDHVC